MLFVCIMLLFLPLISANAFYFHALSLFIDTWFVYFIFFICIMHSAFNLFVFPISMFTSLLLFCLLLFLYIFFYERAMSSPEK